MNNPSISQGEIVIYQPADEKNIKLEVKVEGEEELESIPVVAKFATTAADGKKYQSDY